MALFSPEVPVLEHLIFLSKDQIGRPNGEAFVLLQQGQVQEALKKVGRRTRQYVGMVGGLLTNTDALIN